MRKHHITNLLEDKPLGELTEREIAHAESHIARCSECKRAYDAARISTALVQARASETQNVGPFFVTRVMATLKERELSAEEAALVRIWKAAGALVSTMVALLVFLVGMTVFGADSPTQSPALAASQDLYSPEAVVLQQSDLDDDDLEYDQVIATMYELEDADEHQQ